MNASEAFIHLLQRLGENGSAEPMVIATPVRERVSLGRGT